MEPVDSAIAAANLTDANRARIRRCLPQLNAALAGFIGAGEFVAVLATPSHSMLVTSPHWPEIPPGRYDRGLLVRALYDATEHQVLLDQPDDLMRDGVLQALAATVGVQPVLAVLLQHELPADDITVVITAALPSRTWH
jgi:hypothetical protein